MMQQQQQQQNVPINLQNMQNCLNSNALSLMNSSSPPSKSSASSVKSSGSTDSSQMSNCQSSGGKRSRTSKKNLPDQAKDNKYFERRKRNNVAAKKSRDARKQREDEIAIRASFLEKENAILKAQLQTLKDEAQQLRILLAQKKTMNACTNCSNNCNTNGNTPGNTNGQNLKNSQQNMHNQRLYNPLNFENSDHKLSAYQHHL